LYFGFFLKLKRYQTSTHQRKPRLGQPGAPFWPEKPTRGLFQAPGLETSPDRKKRFIVHKVRFRPHPQVRAETKNCRKYFRQKLGCGKTDAKNVNFFLLKVFRNFFQGFFWLFLVFCFTKKSTPKTAKKKSTP